jgi:sugar (pentulose or hexulose) kinase
VCQHWVQGQQLVAQACKLTVALPKRPLAAPTTATAAAAAVASSSDSPDDNFVLCILVTTCPPASYRSHFLHHLAKSVQVSRAYLGQLYRSQLKLKP